ncbi:MAG: hypothetical protein GY869_30745 [Planctomycetes bacterium]|nr:hypothetical protein [Planctomycetota bacterium]
MNLARRIQKLEEIIEKEEKIPISYLHLRRKFQNNEEAILPAQHQDWLTVKKQLAKKPPFGMPQRIVVDPAREIEAQRKIHEK